MNIFWIQINLMKKHQFKIVHFIDFGLSPSANLSYESSNKSYTMLLIYKVLVESYMNKN